jgi:hypothetical protein
VTKDTVPVFGTHHFLATATQQELKDGSLLALLSALSASSFTLSVALPSEVKANVRENVEYTERVLSLLKLFISTSAPLLMCPTFSSTPSPILMICVPGAGWHYQRMEEKFRKHIATQDHTQSKS